MKIIEAINKIDSLVPNNFSISDKIGWLSTLDGIIKNNVINAHEGSENVLFEPYTDKTDLNTKLLVYAPYDAIYIYWLQAQIEYWSGEMTKYNNSITMYNTTYSEYEKWYNREHAPKKQKIKFI